MTHSEARSIVQAAWRKVHGRAPTDSETAYTQAIAFLENQYGRAGQFAAMAADGKFNWGSLHARGTPPNCPAGSAPGSDQGSVCFQVFSSDVDAAAAFIRVLTKQHWPTIAAMQGSPEDVATAMRKPPAYYEGPRGTEADKVRFYAGAIRGALAQTGHAVPSSSSSSSGALLLVALLSGIGYATYASLYGSPIRALSRLVR